MTFLIHSWLQNLCFQLCSCFPQVWIDPTLTAKRLCTLPTLTIHSALRSVISIVRLTKLFTEMWTKCYVNINCYRASMPWDSVTGTFGRRALLSELARFLQTGSQLSYAVSRMFLGTLLGQELLCYDVHTVWCV